MVMVVEDDEEGNHIPISHEIALYSLRSNLWKIIPFTRYRGYEVSGVCLNGCYYCLAYVDNIQVVMSFDFATETLSSLPLPNVTKSDSYRVVKYKGWLGVVVVPLYEAERSYGLWVMNDGSWSKETVFHTSVVWQLECFSENGELLYFQNFRQEFAVFDRATGKSKTLGFYGINGCIELIPFYESFVQLKSLPAGMAEGVGGGTKALIGHSGSHARLSSPSRRLPLYALLGPGPLLDELSTYNLSKCLM
ncbi:hypothetical protein OROHE_015147 [Orobanche hederae]